MSPPRITQLDRPPTKGAWYMVPTVVYPWMWQNARAWPVFLPRHEDAEHLNFESQHYHIDPRFVDARTYASAAKACYGPIRFADPALSLFQALPLAHRDYPDHPPIVWRRRRCHRVDIAYQHSHQIAKKLTPAFIGRICQSGKRGWICPHKNVPLGTFPAVDGVITCPLHGLQIDAETGEVIGPIHVEAA